MKVKVTAAEAVLVESDVLTEGMVGKTVKLSFSPEWRNMDKVAVFTAGKNGVDVILPEGEEIEVEIPPDVFVKAGICLFVGVQGADHENNVVIPTIWCDLGNIRPGAKPVDKQPDTSIGLPLWAQIQAQIGNLTELETESNENLVSAVNEALTKGGTGSGVYIGNEEPEEQSVNFWVDTDEEGSSDEAGSTASVYELIETIVLEEDMMIRRSQEPGGTPYQFKGILLKGKTTAAAQASGQSFFAYSGDVLIGKSWWSSFSGNTSIRYRHDEFMLQCGWWTTEWTDWSTSISGAINKNRSDVFMAHAAERYPYITSIRSAGTMPAGTTVEVWGVR